MFPKQNRQGRRLSSRVFKNFLTALFNWWELRPRGGYRLAQSHVAQVQCATFLNLPALEVRVDKTEVHADKTYLHPEEWEEGLKMA